MASNLPKEVLIVDTDTTVASGLESGLAKYGISVTAAQDLETTKYHLNTGNFDIALIDLAFEGQYGLAIVQNQRRHDDPDKRSTGFIMLSGKVRPVADDLLMKEMLDIEVALKPLNVIKLLPLLSHSLATKKKLVKFEKIRTVLMEHVRQGKVEESINEVKKRLSEMGQRGVTLICDIYEQAERYEDGLAFITPLAKKNTSNHLYQFTMARFLRLLGRNDEALAIMEEVQKASPKNMQRLKQLGDLYIETNQPVKAVDSMRQLLELNPDKPDMKFEMFRQLTDNGHDAEAQEFCKQTTKPAEVVKYYNNQGVTLSKEGDFMGAIKEYKRALKFFPNFKDNFRIYFNLALAQLKFPEDADMQRSAVHNLKQCIALDPSFDKAKRKLEEVEQLRAG